MTMTTVPATALPTSTFESVDPDTARLWLRKNKKNRKVRTKLVESFARDMAAGNWLLTGESIKFDSNGDLIDGQHRLHAIVMAGVTVTLNVVRDLDRAAMAVIDQGGKRTAADMLGWAGYQNTAVLAAASRLGIAWTSGAVKTVSQSQIGQVTHSEVLDFLGLHPEMATAASQANGLSSIPARMTVIAFTRWLTGQKSGAAANVFFDDLNNLRTNGVGDPRFALLRRLSTVKDQKINVPAIGEAYLIVRAWNAWRLGESAVRIPLGTPTTRFPEPI